MTTQSAQQRLSTFEASGTCTRLLYHAGLGRSQAKRSLSKSEGERIEHVYDSLAKRIHQQRAIVQGVDRKSREAHRRLTARVKRIPGANQGHVIDEYQRNFFILAEADRDWSKGYVRRAQETDRYYHYDLK